MHDFVSTKLFMHCSVIKGTGKTEQCAQCRWTAGYNGWMLHCNCPLALFTRTWGKNIIHRLKMFPFSGPWNLRRAVPCKTRPALSNFTPTRRRHGARKKYNRFGPSDLGHICIWGPLYNYFSQIRTFGRWTRKMCTLPGDRRWEWVEAVHEKTIRGSDLRSSDFGQRCIWSIL